MKSTEISTEGGSKMSEHTPGPWEAVKIRSDHYQIWSDDKSYHAATWGVTAKEAKATAHLIASAPDLLTACKAADAALNSIGFDDKRAIRQTLRAAIAKAKDCLPNYPGEWETW